MNPGKRQRNKKRCQDLCWKVHDRAKCSVLGSHVILFFQIKSNQLYLPIIISTIITFSSYTVAGDISIPLKLY